MAGLTGVPALAGSRPVRRLVSGPVADAWLLDRDGEKLVLRRDRPLARRMGLDRAAEWRHLHLAWRARLGPEPLYHETDAGVLLTGYLPGADWSDASVRGPEQVQALGALLRRVHQARCVGGKRFDLPAIAAGYARAAGSREAADLARRVTHLAGPLYESAPWCLCHHDAHLANVIGQAAPRLLDWEYAALGHPLFDLAVVIRFHDLDDAAAGDLLAGWGGDATSLDAFCTLYDVVAQLWRLAVTSGTGD